MNMKKIILILIFSLFTVFAQEGNPLDDPKKEQNSQPLELPNYVIEGVERLNVRTGVKQLPSVQARFNQEILDSINSLEKQQLLILPPERLPSDILNTEYSKAYLRASYGSFNTFDADGSFGFDLMGYDIYMNAGIEASDGDPKNSDYSKIYAMVFSDYIAPEKFYIFGGSKTRTMINVSGLNYNLYGYDYSILPDEEHEYFSKQQYNLSGTIDSEGQFKNVMFKTGLGFQTLQLLGNPVNGFDNSLNGYLKLQNYWQNFLIAANLSLDFRNASGNNINFIQADGELEYFNEQLSVSAAGGFQFAVNSNGIDRAGLLLVGNFEYRLNKNFTLNAEVGSGLEKTTYTDLIRANPYFNNTPLIDHPYNIAKIKGQIYYHPNTRLGIKAGAIYSLSDRMVLFEYDTLGSFNMLYEDGFQGNLNTEIYYNFSPDDNLTGNIQFAFSNIAINDKQVTYLPAIRAAAKYSHLWYNKLNTAIGIIFVGERYGDIENNITLDSYLDMSLNIDYDISKNFNIFLNLNNLMNQNIYIWENYKERSLFAQFGLMLKL